MRLIFILSAVVIMASSCRRYESCATYADSKQVKSSVESLTEMNKEHI